MPITKVGVIYFQPTLIATIATDSLCYICWLNAADEIVLAKLAGVLPKGILEGLVGEPGIPHKY